MKDDDKDDDHNIESRRTNCTIRTNNIPILQTLLKYYKNGKKWDNRHLLRSIIKKVIVDIGDGVAYVRDGEGDLPLHVAIGINSNWDDGLGDIIEANPDAWDNVCKRTEYLPFMLMMLNNESFGLTTL